MNEKLASREKWAMQQDAIKREKLIQENQQFYNLWRVRYAEGILRAVREFAESDGCVPVVSVSKSKARVVRSKTK